MKRIITSLMVVVLFASLSGIAQATPVTTVPDAGATSALLAIAFGGLAFARRFVR